MWLQGTIVGLKEAVCKVKESIYLFSISRNRYTTVFMNIHRYAYLMYITAYIWNWQPKFGRAITLFTIRKKDPYIYIIGI